MLRLMPDSNKAALDELATGLGLECAGWIFRPPHTQLECRWDIVVRETFAFLVESNSYLNLYLICCAFLLFIFITNFMSSPRLSSAREAFV